MSESLDTLLNSEAFASILPIWFWVLGAIFGSFANVVIYRLPAEESVVKPRSRCKECKTPIKWYDNIPILSWFILRGRCRHCKAPFSFRYPLVEILMAFGFLFCYQKLGLSWFLLEALILVFGLITVSFIDFDHYILPDRFTISGMILGLLGGALNPERGFLDSLLGLVLGGGFLWAIAYFYYVFRKEEGMGGGDIKLLAWIGAVLGWKSVPFVIITSSVVGTFVGLAVAYQQKKGLKTVIPFGPYLALGAVLYLLGGEGLAHWYISLFIPEIQ